MILFCNICKHPIQVEDNASLSLCGHLFHTDCCPDRDEFKCPECCARFDTTIPERFRRVYLHSANTSIVKSSIIDSPGKLNIALKADLKRLKLENQRLKNEGKTVQSDLNRLRYCKMRLDIDSRMADERLRSIHRNNDILNDRLSKQPSLDLLIEQLRTARAGVDTDLSEMVASLSSDVANTMHSGSSRRHLEQKVQQLKTELTHCHQQEKQLQKSMRETVHSNAELVDYNTKTLMPTVMMGTSYLEDCKRQRSLVPSLSKNADNMIPSTFGVRQQHRNRFVTTRANSAQPISLEKDASMSKNECDSRSAASAAWTAVVPQ